MVLLSKMVLVLPDQNLYLTTVILQIENEKQKLEVITFSCH